MRTKHLLYSILFGLVFGLALGIMVYTVPAQASGRSKLATNLTEVSCHHDKSTEDCGCEECESTEDCDECPKCSSVKDKGESQVEKSLGCEEESAACSLES